MNVNLRLHLALDQWPLWGLPEGRAPSAIHRLPGGLTNDNFSLQCGPHHLVLRLNHTDDTRLNILRPVELGIQQFMARIGLSPTVHYVSQSDGYWVRDFIEGDVLQSTGINADTLAGMARVLHSVHHLDIHQLKIPPLDFATKAGHYLALLEQEHPQEKALLGSVRQVVIAVNDALPQGQSLCHMDPLPANWIQQPSGLLSLLDWEYAALAHPLLDFAALYRKLPLHLQPLWKEAAHIDDERHWTAALRQADLLELLWLVAEGQTDIGRLQQITE